VSPSMAVTAASFPNAPPEWNGWRS
jgi:hypothetical protein